MRYGLLIVGMLASGPAFGQMTDCPAPESGESRCTILGYRALEPGECERVCGQVVTPYLITNVFAVGYGALASFTSGDHVVAEGRCSGVSLLKGTHVFLLGDYTAAPSPEAHNFVNYENKLCLQDDTIVACPAAEPECMK